MRTVNGKKVRDTGVTVAIPTYSSSSVPKYLEGAGVSFNGCMNAISDAINGTPTYDDLVATNTDVATRIKQYDATLNPVAGVGTNDVKDHAITEAKVTSDKLDADNVLKTESVSNNLLEKATIDGNGNTTGGGITHDRLGKECVGPDNFAPLSVTLAKLSALVQDSLWQIGDVRATYNRNAPNAGNWIFCDGRSYPQASYPDLYAAMPDSMKNTQTLNFSVPDLRGKVLIGTSDNTDTTLGTMGGYTDAILLNHDHTTSTTTGIVLRDMSDPSNRMTSEIATGDAAHKTGYIYANAMSTGTAQINSGRTNPNMPPYNTTRYYIKAKPAA